MIDPRALQACCRGRCLRAGGRRRHGDERRQALNELAARERAAFELVHEFRDQLLHVKISSVSVDRRPR